MFGKKKYYISPGGNVSSLYKQLSENGHLLIAGATGSGKSIVVNGIIYTILVSKTPEKAGFVFIDPKRVELNQYKGIPHCISYASEKQEILATLANAVSIMENRYTEMQKAGKRLFDGQDIYIIIDELADIMTTYKKQAEPLLTRLAQLGRAAKIHLIACSQNVLAITIPTTIKCNFPVVLGLRTMNKRQSNYLIDSPGCELLPDPVKAGKGYGILRDGANITKYELHMHSQEEINKVIKYWTSKSCIVRR